MSLISRWTKPSKIKNWWLALSPRASQPSTTKRRLKNKTTGSQVLISAKSSSTTYNWTSVRPANHLRQHKLGSNGAKPPKKRKTVRRDIRLTKHRSTRWKGHQHPRTKSSVHLALPSITLTTTSLVSGLGKVPMLWSGSVCIKYWIRRSQSKFTKRSNYLSQIDASQSNAKWKSWRN